MSIKLNDYSKAVEEHLEMHRQHPIEGVQIVLVAEAFASEGSIAAFKHQEFFVTRKGDSTFSVSTRMDDTVIESRPGLTFDTELDAISCAYSLATDIFNCMPWYDVKLY